MRRRLLDILTVLSLLLAIASATFWVRSYWVADAVCWPRGRVAARLARGQALTDETPRFGQGGARSMRGLLDFGTIEYGPREAAPGANWEWDRWWNSRAHSGMVWRTMPAEPQNWIATTVWGRLGFNRVSWSGESFSGWIEYGDMHVVEIFTLPYWSVLVPACVLPAVGLIRRRRLRRRSRDGLCATCGYDLRATPGRCPECGTPVK